MSQKYTGDVRGYGKHIRHIFDAGVTSLLMSLGHRLDLFDVMMEANKPVSARELADLTHMKERYIWEWLSGMAVAEIISFDAENDTFYIPEEHRFDLKITSGLSDAIGMFTNRNKKIEVCFSKDGPDGLNFDDNEHEAAFWKMFSEMRRKTSTEYIDTIFVPVLKKTTTFEMLESGQDVLDAGCGSGEFTTAFAKALSKVKVHRSGYKHESTITDGCCLGCWSRKHQHNPGRHPKPPRLNGRDIRHSHDGLGAP